MTTPMRSTADYNLLGTGIWSVTIQNAWTGAPVATYDLDIVFNGPCEGDCTDEATQLRGGTRIAQRRACLYALDPTQAGITVRRNCIGDFNGNGVCDNEMFGCIYAESVNFDSLATADDGGCEPLCGLRPTASWCTTAMGFDCRQGICSGCRSLGVV